MTPLFPHGNKPFTTSELSTIEVDQTTILDAEKIAMGAFSPLWCLAQ